MIQGRIDATCRIAALRLARATVRWTTWRDGRVAVQSAEAGSAGVAIGMLGAIPAALACRIVESLFERRAEKWPIFL